MPDTPKQGENFMERAEALLSEKLSDEQFGVSELAKALNMSRSNLLRKIKKNTQLSASQYIRQVRLKKSKELLEETSLTVSEISYQVGFSSTSYFIKCFREFYGHTPGEVGKRTVLEEQIETNPSQSINWSIPVAISLIALLLSLWFFTSKKTIETPAVQTEKSIAILPFKNEGGDSSNLYFINGLMASTLNSLQKIEDLRVVSRTSIETYRNTDKTITDIAKELKVNYIVEGSGQKNGDQVLLNIQLIEAASDKQIWADQYNREVEDVFVLQNQIAREIVGAIEVIVTPSELEQISKKPTKSVLAYDYYLRGLDPFYTRSQEGLKEAITLFTKAIEEDPQFALAYANISISYYFLDLYRKEKKHTEQINNYADKALLYDSKSTECLIAKGLYYIHSQEYELALPHLEKALEYNPNSSAAVQVLADYYFRLKPNTAKYLEYALMGIQLDFNPNDSTTNSYIYLQLSNALVQAGFLEEAVTYIDKSLAFDPNNYYSPFAKAFMLFARDRNVERTQQLLVKEWHKDTTRLDILQELGKLYYINEQYDSAFIYYKKFAEAREKYQLEFYPNEDLKIGRVYEKMGLRKEADQFFQAYAQFAENNESIYRSAFLMDKYLVEGKNDLAIEQLKIFSEQDNYQYWILLSLDIDPILKPLKDHPEFDKTVQKIEDRFWNNHKKMEATLKEKNLLY